MYMLWRLGHQEVPSGVDNNAINVINKMDVGYRVCMECMHQGGPWAW